MSNPIHECAKKILGGKRINPRPRKILQSISFQYHKYSLSISLKMVKVIEKLLKGGRKHSFNKRTLRKLEALNRKSDELIKTICEWYKIDDKEKITVISNTDIDNDIDNKKMLDLHIRYQNDITLKLDNILMEKEQICSKMKHTHRTSTKKRDTQQLKEHLYKLENHISNDVNRLLHNKRRKEMDKVCRLERVENKNKVHNFTTREINKDLLVLLNKGPNTVPKTTIPIYERKEKCKSYLTDVIKQTVNCKTEHPKLTPLGLELNKPYLPISTRNVTIDNMVFINDFVQNIPATKGPTEKEQAIKQLHKIGKETDYVINVADKNLGFVINNTTWYVKELDRQLNDQSTYREIMNVSKEGLIDISKSNLIKLNHKLRELNITEHRLSTLETCTKSALKLPSLNLLPKIHKLKNTPNPENEEQLKGRPILNGYNFTTSVVSRLFNSYMENITSILKCRFEHSGITFPCLKNSDDLIHSLNSLPIFNLNDITNTWIITFDFESLYTNITKEYVLGMLNFSLHENFLSKSEYDICTELYNYMQNNTFFHIGHKRFFRQINGLSMGSYDAQNTSNNVLLIHEFTLLRHPLVQKHVKIYRRYIDDGFAIIQGDILIVDKIRKIISELLPKDIPIDFCIRKFQNNFLDLWIKLDYNSFKTKKFAYNIYQKDFNLYRYIHRTSSHTRPIFNGIVKTENIRYKRKSSSYLERLHIQKLFTIRLMKQGYSKDECKINRRSNRDPNTLLDHDLEFRNKKIVKIIFNKSHGLHLAARNIVKRYKSCNKNTILLNKNNRKLKEILLTKHKLHDKIGNLIESAV